MSEIIIMVGLPGSGKSTYIQEHYPNHVKISFDDVTEYVAEKFGLTYSEVWGKIPFSTVETFCRDVYGAALDMNKDVVVDNTNLTKYARSRFSYSPELAGRFIRHAVVVDAPISVIRQRLSARKGKIVPDNVLENMQKKFEDISKDEGFASVIRVKSVE